MIFEHLPTIAIEQNGLYATACGKVFWVELTRSTSYYNAVPNFSIGNEPQLSWKKCGSISSVYNAVETAFGPQYRIVAFLSRKKLNDLPSGYEYVGGHPTFGRVTESPFFLGMSGLECGSYEISAAISSQNMTPFEKEKIGTTRILLKQIGVSLPDPPKESSMSNSVNKNDLVPIFNDADTCPIDKDGGWYVTANGLVVQFDSVRKDLYQHPNHHKPIGPVPHDLTLSEAVWWHVNGDVYMRNTEDKKLCQPLLRIVAKLEDFSKNLPVNFKFTGGHPRFEKVNPGQSSIWMPINAVKDQKIFIGKIANSSGFVYGKDIGTLSSCNLIGIARITVERTESIKQEVVTTPPKLLFADKRTIPVSGPGVYVTANGSVAIIDKDNRDNYTAFQISETLCATQLLWNVDGTPAVSRYHDTLRLVAKIYERPIKEIVDQDNRCSLINARLDLVKSKTEYTHYIAFNMLGEITQTLVPTTRDPVNLNFFGNNRILVNPVPVPTPVSEEVVMSPVPTPVPEVVSPAAQNPVIQIVKATGKYAYRATNYSLLQPTVTMGKLAFRSLRYIFATTVISGLIGSVSYPDTAKKFAASLIPKIELKIEKPSILK
jgi:hypothetical protein